MLINSDTQVNKLTPYTENFELSKIKEKIQKMIDICEAVLQKIE